MLSYQHAYHAASPADLHKHVALGVLLAGLAGRGALYAESHAGRGLYDLSGAESAKTGEAEAGLGRVAEALPDGPPEGPFWNALTALRARDGATAYPGSPAVAATLLTGADRMVLHERHPAELRALRRARGRLDAHGRGEDGPYVELSDEDGHEALRRLKPGARPGLALIDPSYEVKDEYGAAAETAIALSRAWPAGIVMLWYPILPAGRHEAMVARMAEALGPGLDRHEAAYRDPPPRGMTGSGLLFSGLDGRMRGALSDAWRPCAPVLEEAAFVSA
ncbi:MAG: 23S rRNA (adenine(2030)-N(6))-methyltransferase RlmJ [Pseudomonadota bacterium]